MDKRFFLHSLVKISWTEEPGGLQSMGLRRVRSTEWLTLSYLVRII